MRHAPINIRSPRWCASWRAAMVLLALCVAVYVPGLARLPTIDRDEARFAQASRQMFESVALPADQLDPAAHAGGLVIPMVQDRPRLNKPPLIYWLQGAAAAVFTAGKPDHDAIWMYRLPSLLSAIATVMLTWRLGLSMFDPRAAFLAAVMLALCPLFVWEARQARADHVLTACTTAAMLSLWQVWRATREGRPRAPLPWVLALWLSVALGILTKGPVTPLVVLLASACLALLTRRWNGLRATRPLLGLGIVTAAVLPWLALLANHYGLARYLAIVYDETLGRATSARENHAGPPGYHLVLLLVTFWPGSIVTGMAVCRAWTRTVRGVRPWKWRAATATRPRSAELFCLAWVIPAWIVFELTATKLPHYTMPLFPPLALLSARTLLAVSTGRVPRAWGRLACSVYVLWIAATAVLTVGAVAASLLLFDRSWQGALPVAISVAGAMLLLQVFLLVRAAIRLSRRRIAGAFRASALSAAIVWTLLLGLILPRAPSLWATQAIVRTLDSAGWTDDQPLGTLYHEDSLIFETRGLVQRLDSPPALLEFMAAHPDAWGVARERDLPALQGLTPVASLRGLNIARAARERLVILRASAAPPPPAEPHPEPLP